MRHQYGIKGNGCNDCLVSCFYGCCALVQEDKEVKAQEKKYGKHGASKRQLPMVYMSQQQR